MHQFRLIAQRAAPTPAPVKVRKGGGGGVWRPYRVAPKRAPGLAAVKHAQRAAAPAARHQAEPVPLLAVDCDWPETMQRELVACRTVEDRLSWSERWAEQLSGRAADRKITDARALSRAEALWRAPPRAHFG